MTKQFDALYFALEHADAFKGKDDSQLVLLFGRGEVGRAAYLHEHVGMQLNHLEIERQILKSAFQTVFITPDRGLHHRDAGALERIQRRLGQRKAVTEIWSEVAVHHQCAPIEDQRAAGLTFGEPDGAAKADAPVKPRLTNELAFKANCLRFMKYLYWNNAILRPVPVYPPRVRKCVLGMRPHENKFRKNSGDREMRSRGRNLGRFLEPRPDAARRLGGAAAYTGLAALSGAGWTRDDEIGNTLRVS